MIGEGTEPSFLCLQSIGQQLQLCRNFAHKFLAHVPEAGQSSIVSMLEPLGDVVRHRLTHMRQCASAEDGLVANDAFLGATPNASFKFAKSSVQRSRLSHYKFCACDSRPREIEAVFGKVLCGGACNRQLLGHLKYIADCLTFLNNDFQIATQRFVSDHCALLSRESDLTLCGCPCDRSSGESNHGSDNVSEEAEPITGVLGCLSDFRPPQQVSWHNEAGKTDDEKENEWEDQRPIDFLHNGQMLPKGERPVEGRQ